MFGGGGGIRRFIVVVTDEFHYRIRNQRYQQPPKSRFES